MVIMINPNFKRGHEGNVFGITLLSLHNTGDYYMNDVMTKDLEALKAENHQLREENQSLKAENYELRGELEAFMKQLDTSRLSLSRTKNALLGVKSILDLAIDE